MEKIYKRNKEINNGLLCDSLRNFKLLCEGIPTSIEENKLTTAIDQMRSLTGIYKPVPRLNYDIYRINDDYYNLKYRIPKAPNMDSKEIIMNDFIYTKLQIETFFKRNFVDGEFKVTKNILTLPYWCVDWDWYNKTNERFVKICREVDKLVGNKHGEELRKIYMDDDRYKFVDLYAADYNGRVYAKFKTVEDAMAWAEPYYWISEEENGVWANLPYY